MIKCEECKEYFDFNMTVGYYSFIDWYEYYHGDIYIRDIPLCKNCAFYLGYR